MGPIFKDVDPYIVHINLGCCYNLNLKVLGWLPKV